jgi:hypothetical protein
MLVLSRKVVSILVARPIHFANANEPAVLDDPENAELRALLADIQRVIAEDQV